MFLYLPIVTPTIGRDPLTFHFYGVPTAEEIHNYKHLIPNGVESIGLQLTPRLKV